MRSLADELPNGVRATIAVFAIIVIWWLVAAFSLVNPLFLPTIASMGPAFRHLLITDPVYTDALATAFAAFAGLLLSAAIAVPAGLYLGTRPDIYAYIELPIDFFRSVPSSSLFFAFILLFGVGVASKVAVVFYGCALILLVNTIYGVKATKEKRDRVNMLRAFGASRWQVFSIATLHDALPNIAAGLKVSISLALVLVVVTEMFLGASVGLGRRLYDFYLSYNVPEMYGTIIILGLIGFAANKAGSELERRVCFWLPPSE